MSKNSYRPPITALGGRRGSVSRARRDVWTEQYPMQPLEKLYVTNIARDVGDRPAGRPCTPARRPLRLGRHAMHGPARCFAKPPARIRASTIDPDTGDPDQRMADASPRSLDRHGPRARSPTRLLTKWSMRVRATSFDRDFGDRPEATRPAPPPRRPPRLRRGPRGAVRSAPPRPRARRRRSGSARR